MSQNISKIGINLNARQGELQPEEYSILVNGNIQTKDGNFINISNEYSNVLCSKFKPGYKVINAFPLIPLGKMWFFLVNPATGASEIGEISNISYLDVDDRQFSCSACNHPTKEDPPLETLEQIENCVYTTIVSADCLAFDINHPIRSIFKIDDCNIRCYFTDNTKTGLRYIDYDYQKKIISNCPYEESNELDCDRIKIFPDTCYPRINYLSEMSGGENTAGTLQFAVAYSDANSNAITKYFNVTNPFPLFSEPITVSTDYPISKSVNIEISNIYTDFRFINLVVIKTINGVSSPYLVATLPINGDTMKYTYTGIDANLIENISFDDLFAQHPYYSQAEDVSQSNGYVFWDNLKQDRVWNLQPAVNELRLNWQTVELNEGDYRNPLFASDYRSLLRDEVYPYALRFKKTNGQTTAAFHIPAPDESEITWVNPIEEINNRDVFPYSNCDEPLNLRWQVYNTCNPSGYACNYTPPSGQITSVEEEVYCYSYRYGGTTGRTQPQDEDGNPTCYIDPESDEICITDYLNSLPSSTTVPGTPSATMIGYEVITLEPSYETYDCDYPCEDPGISPFPDQIGQGFPKPSNTTCTSAMMIYPQSDSICGRNNGDRTYGYLQYISFDPSDQDESYYQVPHAAYPETPCNQPPNIPAVDNNQIWFSFLATSTVHNISVATPIVGNKYSYTDGISGVDEAGLIMEVYSGTCNDLTLMTNGSLCSTPYCYTAEFLTPGQIYYVKLYSVNPELLNKTVVNKNRRNGSWLDICVNTPTAIEGTCVPITIPALEQLKCTYTVTYDKFILEDTNCHASPYTKGQFGFWQSTATYPCNSEVWGDLAGKPIRHYKFPDFNISPFFGNGTILDPSTKNGYGIKNKIYPIGVTLSVSDIKNILNDAVTKGLITEEEKLSICGYSIMRGNRVGNQSVIAKGLVYDVWSYVDNVNNTGNQVLYPNYPYNDLNSDIFLSAVPIVNVDSTNNLDVFNSPFAQQHPYVFQNKINNKYTFHGPNTSFNNPAGGIELKFETEQYGWSQGSYQNVLHHSEYQYGGNGLSSAALGFATTETSVETISSVLSSNVSLEIMVLGTGTNIPLGYILALIAQNLAAPAMIMNHYYEWLDILTKFIPFRNYAYFYSSVGRYIGYSPNQEGNIRRQLKDSTYLKSGIFNVQDENGNLLRFNNSRRESSLYLVTGDTFSKPSITDYSRWAPGCQDYMTNTYTSCDTRSDFRPISSYYASIKNYLPDQYGNISDIQYIDTGYQGVIDWNDPQQDTSCDTIFGGDTFINRFSFKRKHPFFIQERVTTGQNNAYTPNADVAYGQLYNVAFPRFFFNYPVGADTNNDGGKQIFANVAIKSTRYVDYNMACEDPKGEALEIVGSVTGWLAAAGASATGIASIPITYGVLFGLNYGGTEGSPVFINGKVFLYSYGIPSFLVESDVNLDMRHGENSTNKAFYPYVGDPVEWTQEYIVPISEDNYYTYNSTYSKQNKENTYYTLNIDYSREKEDCKSDNQNRVIYSLQDNDNSDSFDGNLIYLANSYNDFSKYGGKVKLIRGVENNKVLVIQEDIASIFNSYVTLQTNIGTSFVGSNELFSQQPQQYQKTDLGFAGSQHNAFVSTEFGHFWVDSKRGDILQYSDSIRKVGSEKASNWLKENLPFKILRDFPDVNIDNPYKYFGISMGWDERFKRLFITKRDAQLKPEYKNVVTYSDSEFYYNGSIILPTDQTYFTNKSWTISYSPITGRIISFNTFFPNYYVSAINYFNTGVNYPANAKHEFGLWSHLLTNKSYQVFYGHLHPFLFEYQTKSELINQELANVAFNLDLQRYVSEYDWYKKENITFNKALVYNQNQSTGILNLVPAQKNNLNLLTKYPRVTLQGKEILVHNYENIWSFNSEIVDISAKNNQPLLRYESQPMYKESNILALNYGPQYIKNKMRSDFFNIRLINDQYSNYLFNLKYQISKETPSV